MAGFLISGTITGIRCLVTILTDGQGKNGSTVAVSVAMVIELLIMVMLLLGYQCTITITTTSIDIDQYDSAFSLVTIQSRPRIIIYDCVRSADGEAYHCISGGCGLIM